MAFDKGTRISAAEYNAHALTKITTSLPGAHKYPFFGQSDANWAYPFHLMSDDLTAGFFNFEMTIRSNANARYRLQIVDDLDNPVFTWNFETELITTLLPYEYTGSNPFGVRTASVKVNLPANSFKKYTGNFRFEITPATSGNTTWTINLRQSQHQITAGQRIVIANADWSDWESGVLTRALALSGRLGGETL